jgi:hypothetical protein
MRPELGASNPVNILMVVDFPAPFGPRKPKNCPALTRKSTESTAVKAPNRRVSCSVRMAMPFMFQPFADTLAGKLYHELLCILPPQISTARPQFRSFRT